MILNRREFLSFAAVSIAAYGLGAESVASSNIKAIAFDAFVIFDPRPIFALAEQLFPGNGTELSNAWRTRQFEYQWLRALSGQYADFWQTTEDSLEFAAELLRLELTSEKRNQLMNAYLDLKVWPDVPQALESLKSSGIRLKFYLPHWPGGMPPAQSHLDIRHFGSTGSINLRSVLGFRPMVLGKL